MLLALIAALIMAFPGGTESPGPGNSTEVSTRPASYQQSGNYDEQAEQRLLELTNQERQRAGAPPLQLDATLTEVAREHSAKMAAQGKLSHHFPDEASLMKRLSIPPLHLNNAGENVAFDVDADQAHDGLMHSPHHRENLLNPNFNVVGFGVVRAGDQLYVTQDFGHNVATYPVAQAENIVAAAITRTRNRVSGTQLRRIQPGNLRSAACSMANQDRLNPKAVGGGSHYVLTYTNMQPEMLPTSAQKPLQDSRLRSFAVGACYAQSPTYPGGAYWVTVVFY
jgi:uncharacterized protein YkwD